MQRRKNKIKELTRGDVMSTSDRDEMEKLTTSFHKELFTAEGTSGMEDVIDKVPVKVTDAMNNQLLAPYTHEEVKKAIFQMFPIKAPGPDCYLAHFFQRHWDLVGEEVMDIMLRVLRGEEDVEVLNEMILVLIPKVANPTLLSQFRPIY